ncbi:hypothetical protein PGT21_023956 [Puccinia graminis f. sp. tritici]|uniref:Uncharacterized protein n=1 Tax=Puccinia graminis f. sp. tritici TaxID=56615 RepID=A0A5B0MBT9_PUCGR|nr:hypothetical protein PGT21_023956 [Puccinia graminis f. sp. tritici]
MHGVSWEDELDPDSRRGGSVDSHFDEWDGSSSDYHHLKGYPDPYPMDHTTQREFEGDYHSSRTPPGVSDEDWNQAREDLADLGLGDADDLRAEPLDSNYHHHLGSSEPPTGLHYGHSPPGLDDYSTHEEDSYLSDLRGAGSPAHLHQTDEFSANPHHSLDSPSGLNSPGRHAFDHRPLYSPGRSDYGPELAGADLNTDHRDFDLDALNYHNDGHHNPASYNNHLASEDDDPMLSHHRHQRADEFDSDLHGPRHHDPLSPNSHDSDLLYQDNTQLPWSRRASDVRFEEGHPPTMTDTDSLDPLTSSSDYTDFPYDDDQRHHHHPHHHHYPHPHHPPVSPNGHYRSHPQSGFPNAFASPELQRAHGLGEDYHDPNFAEFSQRSPSDFLNRKSRLSPSTANPGFSPANRADRFDDLGSPSRLHPRPSYSSHQHQSPLYDHYQGADPHGSYRDDHLHQDLNYHLPDHERSLGHLPTNDQRHVSPREDIERMRAQLNESLARDPGLSLSGRRSPHSRSFGPSPMVSTINQTGLRPTLDSPLSRSGLPYPITSMEETARRTTLERPRSRSGLPYPATGSGRRSPYSADLRSPHLGLSSRIPVVAGFSPGHQSTSALLHHQDPLRDQLHQISDLNRHIRDSELAHQRERALIDQAAADLARQSLNDQRRRSEAVHERELALADQQVSRLAQHSLAKDLRRNEVAHQRDLVLANQRASQLGQQAMIQASRENDIYRDLENQRRQLDLERAEIARQRDRVDTQTQLGMIDSQLRAIDRQREIDSNRQMANLSRFGNLPSVLRGNYNGRPLASPYLQQSRFLSAARRWSARDKSHQPVVFDHVDAYYRLISDHLPRQLPLFKDPYYNHDSYLLNSASRNPLRPLSSAPLVGRNLGMSDPFVDGIDYDYGYGKVGTLGLKLDQFAREQAYILDDLYLYELLLRLDDSIDELERQRRWQARLRWEEWADTRARVQAWSRMSGDERRRLGLSEGSYWASNLFGIPLDGRFGYQNISNLSRYRPTDLRSHYALSSRLASRYPMWNRGGLGLGRRLSNWLDYARRPPIKSKYLDRQEEIRREYAQRRGEIPPGSALRPPGLMLSGGYPRGPLTGIGASRTLGQHLPPLQRTPSLSSGLLSRGVASRSVPSGLTGPSDLSSSRSKPSGSTALKVPPGPSSSTQLRSPHTPASSVASVAATKSKIPGPVHPQSLSTKMGSGPGSSSRPAVVATKPIPIKPAHTTTTSSSLRPPGAALPTGSRTTGTHERPTTPSRGAASPGPMVVFNPRVKAVPPESEFDPPLPPRPPSRNAIPPPRSALKTPPPPSDAPNPPPHHQLNDERLESITKINTERNRATPAPPATPPSGKTPRGSH